MPRRKPLDLSLQALDAYWELGPGRTLEALQQKLGGKVSLEQLVRWHREQDWTELLARRELQTAERRALELAEEEQRLLATRRAAYRTLHAAGAYLLAAISRRLQDGGLDDAPLLPTPIKVPVYSQEILESFGPCTVCGAGGDPNCPVCDGAGRMSTGSGKKSESRTEKVVMQKGLVEYAGDLCRLMQAGQELDREALRARAQATAGVRPPQETLDAILQMLPDALRTEVAASLAASLAESDGV